jgi:hypothetical protein
MGADAELAYGFRSMNMKASDACKLADSSDSRMVLMMVCSQKPGGEGPSYQTSGCTLPRQHWPSYTAGVRHHQQVPGGPMCSTSYPVASLLHHSHPHLLHQTPQLPPEATASTNTAVVKSQKQPLLLAGPTLGEEEHATAETPLMVTKRESTV